MDNNNQHIIDLKSIVKTLLTKKAFFIKMWVIVFIISSIWILSQPRYYVCEVKLAPENNKVLSTGSLMAAASSLGLNLNNLNTSDAISPILYPELFESPDFIVDVLGIQIQTEDKTISTDYYSYLTNHQKKNIILKPFNKLKELCVGAQDSVQQTKTGRDLDPFYLSKEDQELIEEKVQKNIKCGVDKKTNVITISIKDQDNRVCALLADSIRVHLQAFIIAYRTQKARNDEAYYHHLADSSRVEYEKAAANYGAFQDSHRKVALQTYVEKGKQINNDLNVKLQTYNTYNAQYVAMKAKLLEQTPSFTTLKSATIPQKPAGPRRTLFVLGMLMFSTILASIWMVRKQLFQIK